MQRTTTIPATTGAAVRSWILQGVLRGVAVGAATPIAGYMLVWALSALHPEPLPPGTITSSSLDDASFGEMATQVSGLALYAVLAAGIGAWVGALMGIVVALVAAAVDESTGHRAQPAVIAVATVLVGAAAASWVLLRLEPDAEREVRAVVQVPFVLALVTLLAVPLRRRSASDPLEQHLGQPHTPRGA